MMGGFITIREMAQRLRVSIATAYLLCSEGKVPHHRFGKGRGTIRIREEDLARFIDDSKIEQPSMSPAGLKHIRPPVETRP